MKLQLGVIAIIAICSIQTAFSTSILIHEEAADVWQELHDAKARQETEMATLSMDELIELAKSVIDDSTLLESLKTDKDEYTLEKRTVGLSWLRGKQSDCAKMEQLVVGQKRFVAWMPVCYRWRLYDKRDGQCQYVVGNDPGTPLEIISDQLPGFGAPTQELIAIKTTDYVCINNNR